MEVRSFPGEGTTVEAQFKRDHIDRQPMGDIPGTLKVLCRIDHVEFNFLYITDFGDYKLATGEIKEFLGVDHLNEQGLIQNLGEMVRNNLEDISAGQ